jgi:hypothetical protein
MSRQELHDSLIDVSKTAGFNIDFTCFLGVVCGFSLTVIACAAVSDSGVVITGMAATSFVFVVCVTRYSLAHGRSEIAESMCTVSDVAQQIANRRVSFWDVVERTPTCPVCSQSNGYVALYACRCSAVAHAECVNTWWETAPNKNKQCFICGIPNEYVVFSITNP